MLVLLTRSISPSKLRALRLLHSSVRASDYVGPPDPVSNIRPVLYDDPGSTSANRAAASPPHPYSLDEFRDDSDTLEYQWKLQRQQLDTFNHAFWRDTNTRFEAAKAVAVNGCPSHATAEQREECLSEFYKNWVLQEALRQEDYDAEWRRRSAQEIKLAARVTYQRLKARFKS
ncbi:hypothetical protein F5148DRAFT_1011988 [Russula earlei]|uniref:Uncharacterized protein n=1 Tax=Russula earlei TaxID=71964 RepID=A0ACC0UD23_9AGAM|nr:hypothetical protein F5148DRAFT_1011988 [Russula earlei]